MGYPDEEARGSLRLSLGRSTTDAEIDARDRDRAADPARGARRRRSRDPLGRRRLRVGQRGRVAMTRTLVAMSGGVDSSVAAALLVEAGP